MNRHVADDRGRKIQLKRLPVIAAIERQVGARHGARVDQIGIDRIFANDTNDFAVSESARDFLPRLAVIARAVNVRMAVACERRDVRGSRIRM